MTSAEKIFLPIITGPTASGKSDLAFALMEKLGPGNWEIICCDSMLVYKGLDIGTEKPSGEIRKKVPHHCLDLVPVDAKFDVGDYVKHAHEAIAQVVRAGKRPLLVGGTGLYLRALTKGLLKLPEIDAEKSRQFREHTKNLPNLYQRLEKVDPESAHHIHPRDVYRILRALEVFEFTGKPFSFYQKEHGFQETPYETRKVALTWPRSTLYERINERLERMLARGLEEEVRGILAQGFSPDLRSLSGLAYKYFVQAALGKLSRDEAIDLTKRESRHFAKRQITWFRAQKDLCWFPVSKEPREVLQQICTFLTPVFES